MQQQSIDSDFGIATSPGGTSKSQDLEEQSIWQQLIEPTQQENKTYDQELGQPAVDKSFPISPNARNSTNEGSHTGASNGAVQGSNALSSFLTLFINMTKSIVGSGILFLPVAACKIGLVPAIGLLGFSACFSGAGLGLFLFLCAKIGRNSSIKTLSEASYQMIGTFFNAMIVVKCLLVATLYLSIAISTMKGFFKIDEAGDFVNSNAKYFFYVLQAAIFIFTIPLSLLRTIGKLKYTSYAGVMAVLYLVFFSGVLFVFYRGDGNASGLKLLAGQKPVEIKYFKPFNWNDWLSVIPSFMFAFTCHQNVFPFYNEARDNSLRSMYKLVTISVFASLCIYAMFTVCIASVFGNYLLELGPKQTILTIFITKFSKEDTFIAYSAKLSGIIYVFLLLFSFPLQTLPLKSSLLNLLPISAEKIRKQEGKINVILSLFSVFGCILTYFVSLGSKYFEDLSKIVGAVASPLMMSTFPVLYLLKMEKSRRLNARRMLVCAFGVVGLVLVPLCVYSVFRGIKK